MACPFGKTASSSLWMRNIASSPLLAVSAGAVPRREGKLLTLRAQTLPFHRLSHTHTARLSADSWSKAGGGRSDASSVDRVDRRAAAGSSGERPHRGSFRHHDSSVTVRLLGRQNSDPVHHGVSSGQRVVVVGSPFSLSWRGEEQGYSSIVLY